MSDVMNRPPTLLICRHAHYILDGEEDAGLGKRGQQESETLAEALLAGGGWDCVITSTMRRAVETGAIVARHKPGTPVLSDEAFDEHSVFPDPMLAVRIQAGLRRALARGRRVVVITHSGVIDSMGRIFGKKPYRCEFRPVPNASWRPLTFRDDYDPDPHWICESSGMFAKEARLVRGMARKVSRLWTGEPNEDGELSAESYSDADWSVITDVWSKSWPKERTPLLAITLRTMSDGTKLRCLRDLTREDIPALERLDERYSDGEWVKYLLYPPFVYQLHVHIQRRECPMQFRGVYVLKDVIAELRELGSFRERDLLCWKYEGMHSLCIDPDSLK